MYTFDGACQSCNPNLWSEGKFSFVYISQGQTAIHKTHKNQGQVSWEGGKEEKRSKKRVQDQCYGILVHLRFEQV